MLFKSKFLEKVQETPTDWSFRFSVPEGFYYLAGQYSVIRLQLTHPDTRSNARTCSFSSSPTESYLQFTFTIRDTGFKNTLMQMEPGTEVELTTPRGKMTLEEVHTHNCVMVAGGVGVTPYRGIIKCAYDRKLVDTRITLLYSDKTIEELAFYNELEAIQKDYTFRVLYTLTRHSPEAGSWPGRLGRIDQSFISENAPNLDDTTFMVCGPVEMAQAAIVHLESLGIPKEKIISELFTGY
jgi:ferredoxin-NADP reductase